MREVTEGTIFFKNDLYMLKDEVSKKERLITRKSVFLKLNLLGNSG